MAYLPVLLHGAGNKIGSSHDCYEELNPENIDAINLRNGRELLQILRNSTSARVGRRELDEILRTISRSAN